MAVNTVSGMLDLFAEHRPHSSLPHTRQWCLLDTTEKGTLHSWHTTDKESPTQGT